MARGQHYSEYQKGVIMRYYEHSDTIARQKLGEIVSDLYLGAGGKKADRLWDRARKALLAAGANKVEVEKLIADRSVERLAKLVNSL